MKDCEHKKQMWNPMFSRGHCRTCRAVLKVVDGVATAMPKPERARVINLLAGPGAGKSTTAYLLTGELKFQGIRAELVQEFAKDATYEKAGAKLFAAQDYIFGQQHWRMTRLRDEVDFIVTDGPILLGLVYAKKYPSDMQLSTLSHTILEAHWKMETLNIYLQRDPEIHGYDPAGRNQTELESIELDDDVKTMLDDNGIQYCVVPFNRLAPHRIMQLMCQREWL